MLTRGNEMSEMSNRCYAFNYYFTSYTLPQLFYLIAKKLK